MPEKVKNFGVWINLASVSLMSATTRLYHIALKKQIENNFLNVLRTKIPEQILKLKENNPLIKDEKQMIMEPLYSPTCDVAVGPFSFVEGNLNAIYDNLAAVEEFNLLLRRLQDLSIGDVYNERILELNHNPRCFIAIEVEKSTARDVKHLLGSITNCSLLAKIGIVVVYDDYLDYTKRLMGYLAFVKRKKKVEKELFRNVFVISKSDMDAILQTP